jgi:hypothetical protein
MRNTPSSETEPSLKIAIVEDHEDLREQFVEFIAADP